MRERPIVNAILTRMEVAAPRRGRPGYRWTTGYIVCDPITSARIYPPVRRAEAYQLARELAGKDAKLEFRDDASNI